MFGTEYTESEYYNYWLCLKYILTYKPVDDDDNNSNNNGNNNTYVPGTVLNGLHTLFQLITVSLHMLLISSSSLLPLIFCR